MIRLILILLLWLVPFGAGAEFFCRKYDFAPNESALENHISNVQQDESGFLWFATWNGLVRFDGYNFHAFQPILSSGGEITSNRIYNIRVASTGDIWCVSSDHKLFLFTRRDMEFLNLHSRIPEIAGKEVKSITRLGNGTVWITFRDNTAMRFGSVSPLSDHQFFQPGNDAPGENVNINGAVLTSAGEEWLLTDRNAMNLTRGYSIPGNFTNVYFHGENNALTGADGHITRTMADGSSPENFSLTSGHRTNVNYSLMLDGRIIFATDSGVKSFDPATGEVFTYGNLQAIYLFKDSRHRVWCFGRNAVTGLIRDVSKPAMEVFRSRQSAINEGPIKNPQLIFEQPSGEIVLMPAGGVLSHFDEEANDIKECIFLENDTAGAHYAPAGIKKYLVDDDYNLWVFHEKGADCINFRHVCFGNVTNPGRKETRAVAFDPEGHLWIGDRGNTLRVTDDDFKTLYYIAPDGRQSQNPVPFSFQPAYAITFAPDSTAWVGTKGAGLYHIDTRRNSVTRYSTDAADPALRLPTDTIYDIKYVDSQIWLGSYVNGLSVGRRGTDGRYRFEHVKGQPEGMKIRSIFVAGRGSLLLGTTDGLVTADIADLSAPRFYVNRYRAEDWGLMGNDVMSVMSCQGKIYACVFGSGLSRIDSEDLKSNEIRFTNFMIPSSSSAGQIKTAVADDDGIWVVSEKSFCRFSPATGLYTIYSRDYFTGPFSMSEAAPAVGDNMIVAGTSDGIIYFNPSDMETAPAPRHHVSVTGIRFQNDMEIHPLNDTDTITLAADNRSFSLYLSAMKFGADQNIRFRYRIDGYDNGWNYASESNPEITYNSLPPGDYTLIVENSAPDGSWQTDAREIHIYAEPRFTETTWFRLMIVAVIVLIILSTAYAAIYFKRMRNEIQNKYSLLMTVDNLSRSYKAPRHAESPEADTEEARNRRFIEESVEYLNDNLDNPELVVEDLARNAAMSRTAYFNRIKQITGLSPVDFIKQMRIKRAMSLLDEGSLSIADIAYRVGFTDPKYFSRCFKAEMGMTPTQYLDNKNKKE